MFKIGVTYFNVILQGVVFIDFEVCVLVLCLLAI